MSPEEVNLMVASVDQDGDGAIDYDEFLHVWAAQEQEKQINKEATERRQQAKGAMGGPGTEGSFDATNKGRIDL